MTQSFGDLPGIETDIDDILVWGKTMEDYNKHVEAALKRCQAISLTLKKDKCRFEAPQVTYLGHIISAEGISPDKEKVRAIAEMPPPEDKKGVERLLGVINYVSKFIPDMSTIIHPIRELLKKKIQFTWQWEQIKAFQRVKERLSAAPALAFFNGTKPIVMSCDASQHGLGAVLLQEGRPIAYASRALTSAET